MLSARPWMVATVLAGTLLAGTLWWFFPVFYDNDDLGLMRIAAGTWSGTRDYHLVYTHIGIGYLLTVLYGWFPATNWYSGYLYTVQFVALSTIFYVLLRRAVSVRNVAFCGLALVLVWLQPLLLLQFTTTAIWTTFAAAALLCASTDEDGCRPGGILLALCLASVASMVRFEGFILGCLLAAPLGLIHLARIRSRTFVLAVLASLLIVGALRAADRAVYSGDAEWREYMEYNQVRARLHDSPIWKLDAASKPVLREVGWTHEDAVLFRQWFFPDGDVYSHDKLSAIADGMAAAHPRSHDASWEKLKKHLEPVSLWPLLLHVFLGLYLARGRRGELLAMNLVGTAVSFVIAYWLAHAAKIEDHVWVPLYWAIPMSVLVWTALQPGPLFIDGPVSQGRARGALVSMLAFSFLFGGVVARQLDRYERESRRNEKGWQTRKAALEQVMEATVRKGGPRLFVTLGAAFRNRRAPALGDLTTEMSAPVLGGGWATHSPLWRDALAHQGLSDLPMDMVDREDIMVIGTRARASRLARWLEERRDVSVTIERQQGFSAVSKRGKNRVYRLVRVQGASSGQGPSLEE